MAESSVQGRQGNLRLPPIHSVPVFLSSTLSLPTPTFQRTLSTSPTSTSASQRETSTAAIFVTLSGLILPTVTSTGSTLPSSVPTFQWSDPLSRINTCTSTTFIWGYLGTQETLQFVLISNASPHTNAVMSRKRAGEGITLATNVDSIALSWTWPQVNVTGGQYVLQAMGTDVNAVTSAPFLIINGADTSCLTAEVSTTTASATLAVPSPESSFTPIPTTEALPKPA